MKFKFGLYFLLPFISAVAFNTSFAQNNEPDKTFSAAQEKRIG
ncbi:DsbA family protein, partial [Salmonella enterica subsp. enterica serovar Baguida]|nr:DsbA family protein [Salmonella enterica subsp. enterica serovar Baguida]